MTDSGEGRSFFADLDAASAADRGGDPLGLDQTMPTLEAQARMEELMLLDATTRLLDNLGARQEITFDTNADRILYGEGMEAAQEPGPSITLPVLTTRSEAEYRFGGKTFYIRPIRFAGVSDYGRDIFFVLDENPGAEELAVRNPFLIKLESGDDGEAPGLQIRGSDGSPIPNTPEAIKLLIRLTKQIEQEEISKADDYTRALRRQAERRVEQAQFEAEGKGLKRITKAGRAVLEYVGNVNWGDVAAAGLLVGIVASLGGSIVYFVEEEVTKCDRTCELKKYDKNKLVLGDEAVVIHIGDKDVPIPYLDTDDPLFGKDTVPETGTNDVNDEDAPTFGVNAPGGEDANDPTNIRYVRGMVLETDVPNTDTDGDGDKDDTYTEETFVRLVQDTDGIAIATTAEPDRDHQLTATLTDEGKLTITWRGTGDRPPQALDDDDTPLIVFNRVEEPAGSR